MCYKIKENYLSVIQQLGIDSNRIVIPLQVGFWKSWSVGVWALYKWGRLIFLKIFDFFNFCSQQNLFFGTLSLQTLFRNIIFLLEIRMLVTKKSEKKCPSTSTTCSREKNHFRMWAFISLTLSPTHSISTLKNKNNNFLFQNFTKKSQNRKPNVQERRLIP